MVRAAQQQRAANRTQEIGGGGPATVHTPAGRRRSVRRPLTESFSPSLLHLSLYADEAGETATIILALTWQVLRFPKHDA